MGRLGINPAIFDLYHHFSPASHLNLTVAFFISLTLHRINITATVPCWFLHSPYTMVSPPNRILAKVMDHHGYGNNKDDYIISIRCNGRVFHVEMSLFHLINSPAITARYRKFIAAYRDHGDEFDALELKHEDGEPFHPEEVLEGFHDWLIGVFTPVFTQVVDDDDEDIPPSFDPVKIAAGKARPLLSEYLFPQEYYCRLEAEDDKPFPIYLRDTEMPFVHPFVNIDAELSRDLEHQKQNLNLTFVHASEVEICFRRAEYALSTTIPRRVHVRVDLNLDLNLDLGDTKQEEGKKTTCFFKGFSQNEGERMERELEIHLRVCKSDLPTSVRVVRLLGVVTAEKKMTVKTRKWRGFYSPTLTTAVRMTG